MINPWETVLLTCRIKLVFTGKRTLCAGERAGSPTKLAEIRRRKYLSDRPKVMHMRYVCRPSKVGVIGTGWEDSILRKVLLSLALSLDISPRDHSLPFSPRRLLGGRRPPKRAPRPPSPKAQARHWLSGLPRSASRSPDNDSGNCDKVSSPFLLLSVPSPLSSSRSLSFSTLKIYYSCEL